MTENRDSETIRKIAEFVAKADDLKKAEKMDLSADQDLTIAIMNLVSIEEHFFFTGAKLGKPQYYELIKPVREMRQQLLRRIIKEYEGEVWCISKHLLAASMRVMEVGTKELGRGHDAEAQDLFGKAYDLYSLFWGLNMKLIPATTAAEAAGIPADVQDGERDAVPAKAKVPADGDASKPAATERRGLLASLGGMVKKAIDCCIE